MKLDRAAKEGGIAAAIIVALSAAIGATVRQFGAETWQSAAAALGALIGWTLLLVAWADGGDK